jgi:hypothetical protein
MTDTHTKDTKEKKEKKENKTDKQNKQNDFKLTVKNMRVAAVWNYVSENADCKLCHKNLMLPVQEAGTNKLNGDVVINSCQHGFHAVCINCWFLQANTGCPDCNTVWDPIKQVGSSVYVYKST